jgi:hypothetical protein
MFSLTTSRAIQPPLPLFRGRKTTLSHHQRQPPFPIPLRSLQASQSLSSPPLPVPRNSPSTHLTKLSPVPTPHLQHSALLFFPRRVQHATRADLALSSQEPHKKELKGRQKSKNEGIPSSREVGLKPDRPGLTPRPASVRARAAFSGPFLLRDTVWDRVEGNSSRSRSKD